MEKEVEETASVDAEGDELEREMRAMLDLEERLLDDRTSSNSDVEVDDGSESDERTVTGHIRSATRDGDDIVVTYYVDGEEETDQLPYPDDPTDPDAELNRLCALCGVEPGRVSELSGEPVPLVGDDDRQIQLPTTTSKPGVTVFRAWWWARRRGLDVSIGEVKEKLFFGGLIATAVYGNIVILWLETSGASQPYDPLQFALGPIPFVDPTPFVGVLGDGVLPLAVALFALLCAVWGGLFSLVVGAATLLELGEWAKEELYPF